MKAHLYAALWPDGAQAFVTIDPDTDRLFWIEADYRKGIRRGVGDAYAGIWSGKPLAEGLLMWP
ncbi:hypothetical protein, partial [Paenibacillus darwinianus]